MTTDYLGYKHIGCCKEQGIVSGYRDGYHPEEVPDRAQLAVYVQEAFQLPM